MVSAETILYNLEPFFHAFAVDVPKDTYRWCEVASDPFPAPPPLHKSGIWHRVLCFRCVTPELTWREEALELGRVRERCDGWVEVVVRWDETLVTD